VCPPHGSHGPAAGLGEGFQRSPVSRWQYK